MKEEGMMEEGMMGEGKGEGLEVQVRAQKAPSFLFPFLLLFLALTEAAQTIREERARLAGMEEEEEVEEEEGVRVDMVYLTTT